MKRILGMIVLLVMSFALLTRMAETAAGGACIYDDKRLLHCGTYYLGPGCTYGHLGVLYCY
jgi:hypothetical protein